MTANVPGPVTGGSHGWPFSSPQTDLDAIGYVAEELARLYPDREAYLSRWHAAFDHGVEAGFILAEDAPAMKAVADETAAAVFPK
jgi:Alpha/beta hydrolase domain